MSDNLIERLRKDADDWTQSGMAGGAASNVKWEPTAQIEREAADALTFAANRIAELRATVDRQAEDEGLWFIARTAPEAYLQQELRRLHAQVEEAVTE